MATRRSAFTPTPDHSAFIEEFQQASEVKLDAQARLTLIDAITREFIETFGAATAWSKKAVAATKRFARDGTINALLRLMSCHTSAFTMVVYETALRELGDSTELHVSAHQVSARAAQIRGLIANIPRQTRTAALPPVVRALVDGANHWLSSFEDAPRRPRRPMNTHVDLLVLRVARIIRDAGGYVPFGGCRKEGPLHRALLVVYEYLPDKPQGIKPLTADGFAERADVALQTFHRRTEVWRQHSSRPEQTGKLILNLLEKSPGKSASIGEIVTTILKASGQSEAARKLLALGVRSDIAYLERQGKVAKHRSGKNRQWRLVEVHQASR